MQAAAEGFLIHPNLSRRTFTITTEQMRPLKQRIISDSDLSPSATTPSSFAAVVALAWASFVHAKHAAGVIASRTMTSTSSSSPTSVRALTRRRVMATSGRASRAAWPRRRRETSSRRTAWHAPSPQWRQRSDARRRSQWQGGSR
jgi:hypothetical protein